MRSSWVVSAFAVAIVACDSSVRVGELRGEPSTAPAARTRISSPHADKMASSSWKLHSPPVPCAIYAIAQVDIGEAYLGCNGGRIYRYDGVNAQLVFEAGEESVFSLLWAAPDGQVWAAAQSDDTKGATTQLYHFRAGEWRTVPSPAKRIVSISGADPSNVWIATETEILRLRGEAFVNAFATTSGMGEFRECTFAAPDKGWCVGTLGLAVVWNGVTWTPATDVPWSAQAEVLGVELDPLLKTALLVVYAEPVYRGSRTDDHTCRLARFEDGKFITYESIKHCSLDFTIARRRTGSVQIGVQTYTLFTTSSRGGAAMFDRKGTLSSICGPVLAFSETATSVKGDIKTLVGGFHGFLATMAGRGDNVLSLSSANDSNIDFVDLSVAADGTGWARVKNMTACDSVSDQLVRFDNGWKAIPAPQHALSGRGLAAIGRDHAYTLAGDSLLESNDGTWVAHHLLKGPWSLSAKIANDVWVGGGGVFGHFDGSSVRVGTHRIRGSIEQILGVDQDVWLLTRSSINAEARLVRSSGEQVTEWDVDKDGVTLSGIDASHVWRSGKPAAVWDGETWKPLGFDASSVWARTVDDVYFVNRGDISRWNGKTLERAFHGLIPIVRISGSLDRGFAVGPGGLTVEFARWPKAPASTAR